MGESKVASAVRRLLEDLSEDVAEERVVQYVMRQVRSGRLLSRVLADPFVRNRLSDERIAHVLENPQVLEAVEQVITSEHRTRDLRFDSWGQ